MTKKQTPAQKEHGGACPTCGHCKCCDKAAKPAITFPICTRPHYPLTPWYPDWTYRPNPVWYGATTTEPTLTVSDNTSSARFTQ